MERFVNVERVSLNANNLWTLNRQTFKYNFSLRSISLHNNALLCMGGVFDDLINNGILQRIRLTQNDALLLSEANGGLGADNRYRGQTQLTEFLNKVNTYGDCNDP